MNVDEEDLNSIFYTSGTTGRPKGAMTSHRNIIQVVISVSRVVGIPEGIKQLICIPLFHVTGCNAQLLVGVHREEDLLQPGHLQQRLADCAGFNALNEIGQCD